MKMTRKTHYKTCFAGSLLPVHTQIETDGSPYIEKGINQRYYIVKVLTEKRRNWQHLISLRGLISRLERRQKLTLEITRVKGMLKGIKVLCKLISILKVIFCFPRARAE
jgi:hypothetical protein